jgi:K+-transporting ATPase KdpF subunit
MTLIDPWLVVVTILLTIVSVLVLIYLFIALLRPEMF